MRYFKYSTNRKYFSVSMDSPSNMSHTDLWTIAICHIDPCRNNCRVSRISFTIRKKKTKNTGITSPVVCSEKHQSELRVVDKVYNLFGAEFCDRKNKFLLGRVVERGILLIK